MIQLLLLTYSSGHRKVPVPFSFNVNANAKRMQNARCMNAERLKNICKTDAEWTMNERRTDDERMQNGHILFTPEHFAYLHNNCTQNACPLSRLVYWNFPHGNLIANTVTGWCSC